MPRGATVLTAMKTKPCSSGYRSQMDKPNAHKYSLFVSDAFYTRLREAMAHRGLSQKELALRSKLTLHTVQKLSAGMRPPTLESLRKLCDGLECSADFLIGRIDWTDEPIVSKQKANQ
jgi:DNA-binding Xre family transcriptional regulator